MTDHFPDTELSFLPEENAPRRPRIALMGEFSAGKSTLANLMIGTDPLPMQVVATQLPPVWISYGTGPTVIVGLDGGETPCDLKNVKHLLPEEVAYIRFKCEEEILQMCDIIDMPGISDPNMPSDVWERIMPLADAVIWCSPSTQAWRQSEAAVWEAIDPEIRQSSILLLTRADMLLTDRDRSKVLKRVQSETDELFAHVQMISLLQARDAVDDDELWMKSGADAFVNNFLGLLGAISKSLGLETGGLSTANDLTSQREAPNLSLDAEKTTADHDGKVVPHRPASEIPAKQERNTDLPTAQPEPAVFTPKFS